MIQNIMVPVYKVREFKFYYFNCNGDACMKIAQYIFMRKLVVPPPGVTLLKCYFTGGQSGILLHVGYASLTVTVEIQYIRSIHIIFWKPVT